jgi:hypothetical protein
MDTNFNSQILFYDTLKDIVSSRPYATVGIEEVTSLMKRFDAWVRTITTHPRLAAAYENTKATYLEIATAWHNAIDNAMADGYFPIVIFPVKKFEAAMSFLNDMRQPVADTDTFIDV